MHSSRRAAIEDVLDPETREEAPDLIEILIEQLVRPLPKVDGLLKAKLRARARAYVEVVAHIDT